MAIPSGQPDVVDCVLVQRGALDRARRAHGFAVLLAWQRAGVDALAVTAMCASCGARARGEIALTPGDRHAVDVELEARLDDAERSALERLDCPHRPPDALSLDDDDDMRESYERELVALIVHAVETHNAHYAALSAGGIPITLSWQVRYEDYVDLSLSCACQSCALAHREHQCNDRLRISEMDAPQIDAILLTEEQRAIAYLVGVGCEHLGPTLTR